MSPLSNSELPPEIGDYDEQRPVQGFLMWRSRGPNSDGDGRNFRLSVFMYREAGESPVMDDLSEPDAPEWGQDGLQFWLSIWEGREFDPGHQALIYEYFTADTAEDARQFVAHRRDEVAAEGLFPWGPVQIHVPESHNEPIPDWPAPFATCSADEQAACWAVAAALARRIGPDSRFVKHYPTGDSLYATLMFATGCAPDDGVMIGLGSSIHRVGDRGGPLVDSLVWDELVEGRKSVGAVVDEILRQIPVSDQPHEWADGIGLVADIARDSALLGCDTWIDEAPETDAEFAQLISAFPCLLSRREDREALRFVRARSTGRPLLCIDFAASEVFTLTHPDPMPGSDAALRWLQALETRVGQDVGSRLGLPVFLSKFNRKERFFLTLDSAGEDRGELYEPSLALNHSFRDRLKEATGLDGPEHAWAASDFHLDWLHAALQWKAGGVQPLSKRALPLRHTTSGGR